MATAGVSRCPVMPAPRLGRSAADREAAILLQPLAQDVHRPDVRGHVAGHGDDAVARGDRDGSRGARDAAEERLDPRVVGLRLGRQARLEQAERGAELVRGGGHDAGRPPAGGGRAERLRQVQVEHRAHVVEGAVQPQVESRLARDPRRVAGQHGAGRSWTTVSSGARRQPSFSEAFVGVITTSSPTRTLMLPPWSSVSRRS